MVKRQDELDFMTFGGQRVSARSMRDVSAAHVRSLHAALTLIRTRTISHRARHGKSVGGVCHKHWNSTLKTPMHHIIHM